MVNPTELSSYNNSKSVSFFRDFCRGFDDKTSGLRSVALLLERLIKLFFAFCSSEQEKVVSLHEIFCGLCEWTQQDKLTIYKYDKYNIAGRFGKAI